MKYKCLKLSYKFPDFKSHIHKPKIFHQKIKRRLLSYETPVKKNNKDFSNVSILNFTPSPQKEIRNSFFYENSKKLSLNKMPQKDKKLENKEELIFLINSNKLYGAEFKSIKEYIPFEGELKGIKDIEDNIPEKIVDIKLNKISKDKSSEEEQFNNYHTLKKIKNKKF